MAAAVFSSIGGVLKCFGISLLSQREAGVDFILYHLLLFGTAHLIGWSALIWAEPKFLLFNVMIASFLMYSIGLVH